MKRKLLVLAMGAASSFLVLVGRTQTLHPESVDTFEVDSVGILLLKPDQQAKSQPLGSAVYLGHGILLTNWHTATYAALTGFNNWEIAPKDQLLTYQVGGLANPLVNSWICPIEPSPNSLSNEKPYRVNQTSEFGCIPYNLTRWLSFRPSVADFFSSSPTIPLQDLLFVSRELELAVIKLAGQELGEVLTPPCLSKIPVKKGEVLTIKSHVGGGYPAVKVMATVRDDQPKLRIDPDPRIPTKKRYAAISIIATVPATQGRLVGPGSSGGPVFNQEGKLVGLVWTGQYRENGTMEVWITPASTWLPLLQQAKIPDEDLSQVLEQQCPSTMENVFH